MKNKGEYLPQLGRGIITMFVKQATTVVPYPEAIVDPKSWGRSGSHQMLTVWCPF